MRGAGRGWAAQGYTSSFCSTNRERSRVAIQRWVPCPQKGRTSSSPHNSPATAQAKARSCDRAPNTWSTRVFPAGRQKSEAQKTDTDPKLYTSHPAAELSTNTPGDPHAGTCAHKAAAIELLLIKAFPQNDDLSPQRRRAKPMWSMNRSIVLTRPRTRSR